MCTVWVVSLFRATDTFQQLKDRFWIIIWECQLHSQMILGQVWGWHMLHVWPILKSLRGQSHSKPSKIDIGGTMVSYTLGLSRNVPKYVPWYDLPIMWSLVAKELVGCPVDVNAGDGQTDLYKRIGNTSVWKCILVLMEVLDFFHRCFPAGSVHTEMSIKSPARRISSVCGIISNVCCSWS